MQIALRSQDRTKKKISIESAGAGARLGGRGSSRNSCEHHGPLPRRGDGNLEEDVGRRRLEDGYDVDEANPDWQVVPYFVGSLYMFLALAISCDDFFMSALKDMCGAFGLSLDVLEQLLWPPGAQAFSELLLKTKSLLEPLLALLSSTPYL